MTGRCAVKYEAGNKTYVVRDQYGRGQEYGRFPVTGTSADDDDAAYEAAVALADKLNER